MVMRDPCSVQAGRRLCLLIVAGADALCCCCCCMNQSRLTDRGTARSKCASQRLRPLRATGLSSVHMAAAEPYLCSCEVACSAESYWALRDDQGFCEYVAIHADPPCKVKIFSWVDNEDGTTTRVMELRALKNPVPYLLQGTLGCRDGFAIKSTERWKRGVVGTSNPCLLTTELPVLKDKISISGSQWVEPHSGDHCQIFMELHVRCTVRGAGKAIAKLLSEMFTKAFMEQPARVSEWTALRRAAADVEDRVTDRTSRPSEDVGEAGPTGGVQDESRRTTTHDAGARLRSQLRWRMALMYVRLTRVLEASRRSEGRICEVLVSEPRTEGYRPRRHTTYRVQSRVAASGDLSQARWVECRKRFSHFETLRTQVLACTAHACTVHACAHACMQALLPL